MKTGSEICFCLCNETSSYLLTKIIYYLQILLLICFSGTNKVHPASAVSNHRLPSEDTNRSWHKEIRLLRGKMWTCPTESQVSFFFPVSRLYKITCLLVLLSFFFLRSEMVEIQLDTYTMDSISAHRKIRQDTLRFCLLSQLCSRVILTYFLNVTGAVFAKVLFFDLNQMNSCITYLIWQHNVFTLTLQFQREAGLWAKSLSGREAVCRVETGLFWDLGQRVWSACRGVLQTEARDWDKKLGVKGIHTLEN